MVSDWQTPIAFTVVLIALTALVRGVYLKRKKPGCGMGCGCSTDAFKAKLKH
jgi:hypothetical protein